MPGSVCGRANFFGRKKSEERIGQTVEKILRSSIFSFLCIRIYVIGTEDSNERNPSGVRFYSSQLGGKRSFSTS